MINKLSSLLIKYSLLYIAFTFVFSIVCFVFNAPPGIIIVSFIVSLVFFLISLLFFDYSIVRKIKALNVSAVLLGQNEKHDTSNNFEDRMEELNKILSELEKSKKQFSSFFEINCLYENLIQINKRITDELKTAKIFKINRNEFLGNVAHELRTPIFAIQLSIESLSEGAVNDPAVNMDFLKRALVQTNRLRQLVDDLISISRLEAGMKLSRRYFEINGFVREVVNELNWLAEKKNIRIIFVTDAEEKEQVFGDRDMIEQVLTNLIDNAIKYTPENGLLTVFVKPAEKEIEIGVEDTGAGIPTGDLPRIFERFYRVDKSRTREMGGSGLGLSIVKHILELHNSQIKVESEIGKGTKFWFNLPK